MIDAAIFQVTKSVTKQWTKQRKAEERGRRPRSSRAYVYSSRVNFTDIAARIIPDAYKHGSGDGRYPVKKRQMYYAARDQFREMTGRPIDADYFCQSIMRKYLNTHPETARWKIVADARGHLIIPNAGRKLAIPLGVLEVEEHLRTADSNDASHVDAELPTEWPSLAGGQRYQAVIFIEKEGFGELMEAARIAERFQVAILSGKGQSTEAPRLFVDQVCYVGSGVPLFTLTDFDKFGFVIRERLTTENRLIDDDMVLYRFENKIDVTDLGLRLDDVRKWDLEWAAETAPCTGKSTCKCFQCQPLAKSEYGITDEEYDFLYSGKRVELNALTSPQFVEYIETKLKEHGIREDWAPADDDVIERAYRRALVVAHVNHATEEAAAEAIEATENIESPQNLRKRLQAVIEKSKNPWDQAIYRLAEEALNR